MLAHKKAYFMGFFHALISVREKTTIFLNLYVDILKT